MERHILWIVAAAVAVLIVIPVALLLPATVQGWMSNRPIAPRPLRSQILHRRRTLSQTSPTPLFKSPSTLKAR